MIYLKRTVETLLLGATSKNIWRKESTWQGLSSQMSCLVASLNPISIPNTNPNKPRRVFLPVLKIEILNARHCLVH